MTYDKKPLQYYSKISISISTRAVAANTIPTLMFPCQKQYTIITNIYLILYMHAFIFHSEKMCFSKKRWNCPLSFMIICHAIWIIKKFKYNNNDFLFSLQLWIVFTNRFKQHTQDKLLMINVSWDQMMSSSVYDYDNKVLNLW